MCGLVVLVALAALVPGQGDAAEDAPAPTVEDAGAPAASASEVERARALLLSGELARALDLLLRLTAEAPDDPDANFLLGMGALGALRGEAAPDGSAWTEESVRAFQDGAVAAFQRVVNVQPAARPPPSGARPRPVRAGAVPAGGGAGVGAPLRRRLRCGRASVSPRHRR